MRAATAFTCGLFLAGAAMQRGWCQKPDSAPVSAQSSTISGNQPGAAPSEPSSKSVPSSSPILQWEGLPVRSISFEGVPADQLRPLSGRLPQAVGAPLTEDDLKSSLRQLYATGLYETIEARATRQGGGVALTFTGTPRTFIGMVGVYGATGATMNMQLQRASQLEAGTRLTPEKMTRAVAQMRATLEQNGYYESTISHTAPARCSRCDSLPPSATSTRPGCEAPTFSAVSSACTAEPCTWCPITRSRDWRSGADRENP